MGAKKYVPQGTFLACDKGTVPMEFKITNNNNSFLFGEPIANTGDMVPMVNVQPFGVCSITSSACVPAPIMWDGFEDGIFVGFFNPLLEDSVLPCGLGGKIEIFYSLEDATAACAEEESSFWETLGKVVLVVAAVALVVISGGAAIAPFAAIGAASGALATGIAVTVFALEVGGAVMGVMSLVNYARDGDEEALFKDVALGFLFLGAGKVIGHYADDIVKLFAKGGDELIEAGAKGADEVLEAAGKGTDDLIEAGDDAKSLLRGEGDTGTYKELIDAGSKGDNITPHHMPSDKFMKAKGGPDYKYNDGIAMNMEQPHPGVGGRHRQTATYNNNMTKAQKEAYEALSPRDALAKDIMDARKIYQEDGLYNETIRDGLQDVIKQNKDRFPDIFGK